MKQFAEPLVEFIQAFGLSDGATVPVFKASVTVKTDNLFATMKTDVHIVTLPSKEIDIIYLLHPAISRHAIPDMLMSDKVHLLYRPHEGLQVKGFNEEGEPFSILVEPVIKKSNDTSLVVEGNGRLSHRRI